MKKVVFLIAASVLLTSTFSKAVESKEITPSTYDEVEFISDFNSVPETAKHRKFTRSHKKSGSQIINQRIDDNDDNIYVKGPDIISSSIVSKLSNKLTSAGELESELSEMPAIASADEVDEVGLGQFNSLENTNSFDEDKSDSDALIDTAMEDHRNHNYAWGVPTHGWHQPTQSHHQPAYGWPSNHHPQYHHYPQNHYAQNHYWAPPQQVHHYGWQQRPRKKWYHGVGKFANNVADAFIGASLAEMLFD